MTKNAHEDHGNTKSWIDVEEP